MIAQNHFLRQGTHHDSFYLYDQGGILSAIQTLQSNFPNVRFLYSLKTNPHPHVVSTILSQGVGVDAASVAEVFMGVSHQVPKAHIQYSAPGKTEQNIRDTLPHATIIADSLSELQRIQTVAHQQNTIAHIGVRLNPHFSFFGNQGTASKFGIDEDEFFTALPSILALPNVQIIGLHVHIRSQELSHLALMHYYRHNLQLACNLQSALGVPLTFVNMGSGIGIPYESHDQPLDMAHLGAQTTDLLASFAAQLPQTQIYIETGRYLIGEHGFYATKVLDKKTSYGITYVILQNTLNGFIRPSLAQLVQKYSPDTHPISSEPLYTTNNPAQIHVLNAASTVETVTLVGNLCTATDVVAADISLPTLSIGDMVVFTNAGSYAAVISPMQFSSQTPPAQLFLQTDGTII